MGTDLSWETYFGQSEGNRYPEVLNPQGALFTGARVSGAATGFGAHFSCKLP